MKEINIKDIQAAYKEVIRDFMHNRLESEPSLHTQNPCSEIIISSLDGRPSPLTKRLLLL